MHQNGSYELWHYPLCINMAPHSNNTTTSSPRGKVHRRVGGMGGRRISVHPMQQLVIQPAPASNSAVAAEGQQWHLPATEIMRRRSIHMDADAKAADFGPSSIAARRGLVESPDMLGGQDNFRMQRLEADMAELSR